MERQNCLAEITESENPLYGGEQPERSKDLREELQETRRGLSRHRQKMTLKPEMTSGQSKVTSFIVITSNLEFSSTCRKKKHSQSHWNTLTWPGLVDVLQESRIHDHWSVYVDRKLSDSWTRFTKFLLFERKPSKGFMCGGKRLAKIEGTTRPDCVWPDMVSGMSEAGMVHWRAEARKCSKSERNFFFIDRAAGKHEEAIKNARKKLEIPKEAAMPCKLRTKQRPNKSRETDDETKSCNTIQQTKHACIVEAHQSTRKLLESTLPRDHEDPIAEEWFNSTSHYNLVRRFIPMFQAINIQDAKEAMDKDWEKLEKLPAWQLNKAKSK